MLLPLAILTAIEYFIIPHFTTDRNTWVKNMSMSLSAKNVYA